MKIDARKLLDELKKPESDKVRTSVMLTEETWLSFQNICGKGNASKMLDKLMEIFIASHDDGTAKEA